MTKKTPLSRPATSAIAALLVLSTPGALAQEAPAAAPAPPTVMVPPVAPTTAPAPPADAPVAAPVPVLRLPLDIAPEPAAAAPPPRAAAKTSARATAQAAARPAPAERAAPVATAPAATAVADEAAAPALAESTMAPVAPVADPAPTPLPAERVASGDGFPWEIAGGAAALLLVGGAGLAFARRRRVLRDADQWEFGETSAGTEWVPATPVAARPAEAVMNPEPIPAPRASESARRTTPAFAAAPSGSMGRHEAMALVGPTADNPFETLAKRLKRARFLDRKERFAYDEALATHEQVGRQPVSAWEIAQRPAPAPAEQRAEQLIRRPEPVARGLSHSFRRPGLARD